MYIHPPSHFNRDTTVVPALDAPNGTTSSDSIGSTSTSQPKPQPTGYVILAVVLSILLLSLAGYVAAHRHRGSFFLCTRSRKPSPNQKSEKSEDEKQDALVAPRMQREGRGHFLGGVDIAPTLSVRTESDEHEHEPSDQRSSCVPASPNSSSEGPLTPSFEHERHGGLKLGDARKDSKKDNAFVLAPIVVDSPTQMDKNNCFTEDDLLPPDYNGAPRVHYFEDVPASPSSIRPHGLPLSVVPEDSESSRVPTLPSMHFDASTEESYGIPYDH